MSKKINCLTGSQAAIEHLRVDVDVGHIAVYDIPNFPTGIIPTGYLNKCSSVAVAVSGSANLDYLIVLPQRPDTSGSAKVIDIDPVIFCFKTNDLNAFPTGVALSHQNFPGRTSLVPGFETFSVAQTLDNLRQTVITGSQSLNTSPEPWLNAISHSVAKLNSLLGQQISGWNNQLNDANEPGM